MYIASYGVILSCLYAGEVDWQMIWRYLRYLSFYSMSSCLKVKIFKGKDEAKLKFWEGEYQKP